LGDDLYVDKGFGVGITGVFNLVAVVGRIIIEFAHDLVLGTIGYFFPYRELALTMGWELMMGQRSFLRLCRV